MYTKIRYRARLSDPAEISHLRAELEDICQANNWKYHLWDEEWKIPNSISMHLEDGVLHAEGHAPLKGILLQTDPEEEGLWLTFTPDGILNSLFTLQDPTYTADDAHYPWQRVKVRFGDTRNFAAICHLFRFVAEKYCADFQVKEETGYWIHQDLDRLEKFMAKVADAGRQLNDELAALYTDDTIDPETKHEIIRRLLKEFGKEHRPYDKEKE